MENMYNKDKIKARLFEKFLYHTEILKGLTKLIFNSTELFENKYMDEYDWIQFKYFSKRLTKYGRDINELRAICSDNLLLEINKRKLKIRK